MARPVSEARVMATLFKPTRPSPLATGSEVVARDGKPHVRVREKGRTTFYPLTVSGTHYLKPAAKWAAEVRFADGTLKRVRFSPNRDAAALMLAELLKRIENEKIGVVDRHAGHRKRPLAEHVGDWLAVLTARGRDDEYTSLKKARVSAILAGCGFVYATDLSADRLERFLESLRTGPKKLSVQTTNDYLQAASQFCKWLVENGRIERNPFASAKKGDAARDRRHVRRPLDFAELQLLVTGTRTAAVARRKLTAESRAVLYATAAFSGYRAGELAALTPAAFRLDGRTPTIDLSGEFTKNGKDASQPVPNDLAELLRGFLAGLPRGVPVWPGTWCTRSAEMIRRDAAAAGLTLDVDARGGPEVLDFHSLRGTYATFLDGLDMSLKTRQELMRHSDPRLTMNRYTKAKLHDMGAAVQNLPKLDAPPEAAGEPALLRMTGTDAAREQSGAVAGGSGRVRLRTGEETGDPDPDGPGKKKPPGIQGFEDGREQSKTLGAERAGVSLSLLLNRCPEST